MFSRKRKCRRKEKVEDEVRVGKGDREKYNVASVEPKYLEIKLNGLQSISPS